MPRSLSAALKQRKNALDDPGVWLELWEVDVGGGAFLYLVNHPEAVEYPPGGTVYSPVFIAHEPIQQNQAGKLLQVVAQVSNVDRQVQSRLEAQDGLRGKTVTIKLLSFKAPIEVAYTLSFIVDSVVATTEAAAFVLSKAIPGHGFKFPSEVFSRDTFPGLPIA